jgi:hypothetical protein
VPKLTAKFIESEVQYPARGQLLLRDNELTGFGLRVTPRCMSYIVECRVNGTPKRVTLCRYDEMTPEDARKKAKALLAGMAVHKAAPSTVPTLGEVLAKYLQNSCGKHNQELHVSA